MMKSLSRIRKREGRCFELCGLAITYEDDDTLRLAHGWIEHPELPFGVVRWAWLILADGRVYDAVQNRYYPSGEAYTQARKAVPEIVYTVSEARDMMGRIMHYGPWDDDDRVLAEVRGRCVNRPDGWRNITRGGPVAGDQTAARTGQVLPFRKPDAAIY